MAAKRPRQARENVTEIPSPGVEAANENSAQDGFAPADTGGQPELEHAAATDAAEQILGANPLPVTVMNLRFRRTSRWQIMAALENNISARDRTAMMPYFGGTSCDSR